MREEAAMVETGWGVASFSPSLHAVEACCRVVRGRQDHGSRAGVPEDVVEALSKTVRKHSTR
jgi:hypothetical protein